jgi:hypothetical protein
MSKDSRKDSDKDRHTPILEHGTDTQSIYVTAIATAMLGWLWLLTSVGLDLVEFVL